jgi:hypothetical protein
VEAAGTTPLTVDALFQRVVARYGPDACGALFKTALDLSTFLRIYSHIFHIQANMVTLVPQRSFFPPPVPVSHNGNKVQPCVEIFFTHRIIIKFRPLHELFSNA